MLLVSWLGHSMLRYRLLRSQDCSLYEIKIFSINSVKSVKPHYTRGFIDAQLAVEKRKLIAQRLEIIVINYLNEPNIVDDGNENEDEDEKKNVQGKISEQNRLNNSIVKAMNKKLHYDEKSWRTFKLILWNHIMYSRRHWYITCVITFLTPVAFLLFAYLRKPLHICPKIYQHEVEYHSLLQMNKIVSNLKLCYSSKNQLSDEIMNRINLDYELSFLKGFNTESEMLAFVYNTSGYTVIVFEMENSSLQEHLKYKIRLPVKPKFIKSPIAYLEWPFRGAAKNIYFNSFLAAQFAVDMSFIKQVLQNTSSPDVDMTLQEMPYPPHDVYTYSIFFNRYIFLIFLSTSGIQVFFFTMAMCQESLLGTKRMLEGMGVKPWMNRTCWVIHCTIPQLIENSIVIIIFKCDILTKDSALLNNSNGFLVFLTLLLYGFTIQATCGFFTVCFSSLVKHTFRPEFCALITTLFWYLHPLALLFVDYSNAHANQKIVLYLLLLLPNICLFLAVFVISVYEQIGGIHWHNLFVPVITLTSYPSVGYLMLTFIIDLAVYIGVTWYLSKVLPSEFGINKNWNFLLMKYKWIKKSDNEKKKVVELVYSVALEKPDENLEPVLQIRNLNKVYEETKKLVSDLSIDIYKNQLTVILGHCRSGKTAILDMITGFVKPSSGVIFYEGQALLKHLNEIRENIGYCPHKYMLLPYLTVIEHMILYGKLRGLDFTHAVNEARNIMSVTNLLKNEKTRVSQLNKYLKHRVTLAVSLIGGKDFIILDEPSWQMSPETKREFWDYLIHLKKNRTVVMSCSDIQEAEILADRLLILHNGKMLCYGTINFIERYFQTGYILSIFLQKPFGKNIMKITNIVRDVVKTSRLYTIDAGCVVFSLSNASSTNLAQVMLRLDAQKTELGILQLKISILSLDEVYERADEYANRSNDGRNTVKIENERIEIPEVQKYKKSWFITKQQLRGLFLKRLYYIRRKWKFHILAFLLPAFYEISIGMLLRHACGPPAKNLVDLDISMYEKSMNYYSNNDEGLELGKRYEEIIGRRHQTNCENVVNVSESIIKIGMENIHFYHSNLIVASEFNKTGQNIRINALYGNLAQHGPPISLNLVDEALLRYVTNNTYKITVTNNPLPVGEEDNFELFNLRTVLSCSLCSCLISLMVHVVFHENITGFRRLQLMTGVARETYWFAQLFVDVFFGAMAHLLALIILYISDYSPLSVHSLYSCEVFGVVILFYILSTTPVCYIFCIMCRRYACAWLSMNFFNKFGLLVHQFTNRLFRTHRTRHYLDFLLAFTMPSYAFATGMFNCIERSYEIFMWDIQDENLKKARCENTPDLPCCNPDSEDCLKFKNFFKNDNIILSIYALCLNFCLYSAVLYIIDREWVPKILPNVSRYVRRHLSDEVISHIEDVDNESFHIYEEINTRNIADKVLLHDVQKTYGEYQGIKRINFGIVDGECFGILGKTGAGKSVLIKLIVGEEQPTDGSVFIFGQNMRKHLEKCQKKIGYCPQTNALLFELTGREVLTCFAYMHGIKKGMIKQTVSKWLNIFEFQKLADIPIDRHSIGAMRTINVLLALIGSPLVVVLDQPATGVDPATRQKMWAVISSLRHSGRSVIIGSTHIEECELLCDRLAILVNGSFRCIGDLQYLRDNYVVGLTAIIKLRQLYQMRLVEVIDDISTIKSKITRKFTCVLKESDMTLLHYNITETTITELFLFMEKLKNTYRHIIEDYVVSNTSLEHVFLSLSCKDNLDAKPWWRKSSI